MRQGLTKLRGGQGFPFNGQPEQHRCEQGEPPKKSAVRLERIPKEVTEGKLDTFELETANKSVRLMLETTINFNSLYRGFYLPTSRTMTPRPRELSAQK